jgi:hypothetical protein
MVTKKGLYFYFLCAFLWVLAASIFPQSSDLIYFSGSGLSHFAAALFVYKNLGVNQKKTVIVFSKWLVFVAAQNLADELFFNPINIENQEYTLCFLALLFIVLYEYFILPKTRK